MLVTDSVRNFLTENKWLIFAAFLFVAWKFFLIHTLWNDRPLPPVPDDSYIYILHLDSTIGCTNLLSCSDRPVSFSSYAGFDHLAYRLVVGIPAGILGLDPVQAYHFGFYLGTLLLSAVLLLFTSALNPESKRLVAFSIFILTLYNGAGSFHGFYWVVPSFFSLSAFLVTFSTVLVERKCWALWLGMSVPFGIFSHTLGLYLLAVLPLFAIFHFMLAREYSPLLLKKILFTFLIAGATYIPVAFYYSHVSYGNPYGPERIMENAYDITAGTGFTDRIREWILFQETDELPTLFPGWEKINRDYLQWIFPSWIGYIVFITCIGVLFRAKQYRLLCIYFSALLFSFAASINIHAERSLVFLWPITYLIYGQAAWFAWKSIHQLSVPAWFRICARGSILVITIFSILLSLSYSYLWNRYLNLTRDMDGQPETLEYLQQHVSPGEKIMYSETTSLIDNILLLQYGTIQPQRTIDLREASYYVVLNAEKKADDARMYDSLFQDFFGILSRTLLFDRPPQTKLNYSELRPEPGLSFEKAAVFGDIEIYRIILTN